MVLLGVNVFFPHFRQNKEGVICQYFFDWWTNDFCFGFALSWNQVCSWRNFWVVTLRNEGNWRESQDYWARIYWDWFGGRSFDFQAGEIPEYRTITKALMKQWQNPNNTVSPPSLVAAVIFDAVIDETNQLRYRAGNDAKFLLDCRKKMANTEFFEMMNK